MVGKIRVGDYPLTKIFLFVCVAIYLAALSDSGFEMKSGLMGIGAIRASQAVRWGAMAPVRGEDWRMLSAIFVHFGALHIVFNSMAVLDLGRAMERLHGSARFGTLFLLTGLLGFVASDVYHGGLGFTAGASGALFGLIGGRVGFLLSARDPRWKQLAGRAVVYGVLFAIAFPVNNAAHAGGFISGIALGVLLQVEKPSWKLRWLYTLLTFVLLLASIGSIVLAQTSTAWQEVQQLELEGVL